MGDGFYRSKDPTNSIKVLKEATKDDRHDIAVRMYKHTTVKQHTTIADTRKRNL